MVNGGITLYKRNIPKNYFFKKNQNLEKKKKKRLH